MQSITKIKETIQCIAPFLRTQYGVKKLFLFGSYARGEAQDRSDIDLLVEFEKTPDLLSFIELEEFLTHKLGNKVDLVPKRKLHQRIKAQVLQEAIAV